VLGEESASARTVGTASSAASRAEVKPPLNPPRYRGHRRAQAARQASDPSLTPRSPKPDVPHAVLAAAPVPRSWPPPALVITYLVPEPRRWNVGGCHPAGIHRSARAWGALCRREHVSMASGRRNARTGVRLGG
jgi:hypothetical protein